jgi:DNA-damage-inducible protein D
MKERLGIPQNRAIADFLPTVTIAAKNFATEMTNFNVKNKNLQGEIRITDNHMKNNNEVRNLMLKNNIVPENLPPEEDIKKLERKVKSNEKKLANNSKKNII